MRLKSLHASGFRSIQELSVSFEPGLTTFVGENNVGKSGIREAVSKVIQLGASRGIGFAVPDRPYGQIGPAHLELNIELADDETREWLFLPLTTGQNPSLSPGIGEWLSTMGNDVSLSVTEPSENRGVYMVWGELHFLRERISAGPIKQRTNNGSWVDATKQGAQFRRTGQYTTNGDVTQGLCANIAARFRVFDEFRSRATAGQRSGELESFGGPETASVLLNLKNHPDRLQQRRYREIGEAFKSFFPRFELDAVETEPGGGPAELLFYEEGHEAPLSLQALSSGVNQILTLVTNLVARSGLIIFIEHPELHLHPHAIRSVESLIRKSSAANQIVVISHDPRFVDPESPRALRRVWLTSHGTKVLAPPENLSAAQAGQFRTALRDLGGRELVFARCVLLVEDESQQNFILGVAAVLGQDLDATGISVVKVDGETGYKRYFSLLNALGIPHVALKDKHWGNKKTYPPGRFFSFGMELEDYQDDHGLAEKREAQKARLGHGSKERVQRPLAESLTPDEVPELFSELLQAAVGLATGEPSG